MLLARRKFYVSLLLVLLTLTLIPQPLSIRAAGENWLSGWQYRREITITEQSGNDLTDYQVLVDLTSVALSGANADCSDIRFTDSDGSTLLSFWREACAGTAAGDTKLFWVKVPSIPASSTVSIYVYYGNSAAGDMSNTTATFIDDISGLVAAWHFDEGSGTIVHDSSGNGNDGTLNGPTWLAGKFGGALSFDGANDYVGIPSSSSLVPDSISVAIWFRTDKTGSTQRLVNKYSYTDVEYSLLITSQDKIYWDIYDQPSGVWDHSISTTTVAPGVWYHIVGTYNASTGRKCIYVNGNLEESHIADITYNKGTEQLLLGKFADNIQYFDGLMDEVFIFNKELTQEEVINMYNNYGYTSEYYLGHLLIRKYINPEPSVSVGAEEIVNQPPSVSIFAISPSSATRGNTIQISGTASDSDGSVAKVYVNISDPNGVLVVTNGLASGTTSWSYSWGSSASSTPGYYTICAISEDDAGAKSTQVCQSNAFQLLNNPPEIVGNGSIPTPPISLGTQVVFWLNATDFENSASEMTARITITAPNGTVVVSNAAMTYNSVDVRWKYQFTPDTTGTWSVTMSITDANSDSDSTSWSFDVTAGPDVQALVANPTSTLRPGNITLNATVYDPDTPPSSLSVSYTIYDPDGSQYATGSMVLNASSGQTGYFTAQISIGSYDKIGYYDVQIDASDGSYSDQKLFANAFSVNNTAPTVSSVTVNTTSIERGKTVLISVSASDPDTPAGSLTVNVKIDDPSGTNVLSTTASWNSATSRYETTWSSSANSALGQYSVEATAADPDGSTGGPATASFTVENALPQIISLNVSNSTVYVNSSVLIQVNASDYETPQSDLSVKLTIDGTVGNATWNATSGFFEYSFVPTQAKSYSVQVNVTDADGGTASKTFSNVITAITEQMQNQTQTEIQNVKTNLTGGFDLRSWLSQLFSGVPILSELQQVLGTANTLISLSIGLFTLYAIVKSQKDKRKRRR